MELIVTTTTKKLIKELQSQPRDPRRIYFEKKLVEVLNDLEARVTKLEQASHGGLPGFD